MIKLSLSAPYQVLRELQEHLSNNGYHFVMDLDGQTIEIDEDEFEYLRTILRDRGVSYNL